jgi:hypothetical protein
MVKACLWVQLGDIGTTRYKLGMKNIGRATLGDGGFVEKMELSNILGVRLLCD